ncbi:MAG: hypothetical protein V4703_12850 [Actinomycetota bacterium]
MTAKQPAAATGGNPALAPVVEERTPRTYLIVGPRRVLGREPGTTFTAVIPAQQEQMLIHGGHITLITKEI